MKDVQCYELFGGIALKNHAFSFHFIFICAWLDSVLDLLTAFLINALCTYKNESKKSN